MKNEETLHLLVIDDSPNDAETVSNVLRNGGQAVRAVRAEDAEALREMLKDQLWDMIVAKPQLPFLSAVETLAILHDMQLDIPVLLMSDDASTGRIMEVLSAGARDTVSLSDTGRLAHVLMREFGDSLARRRHKACLQMLEEANLRAQSLVDSSRDAIAYVHEGMHVYANESYLQLFGYSGFAEVEGLPLLSMVASADQAKFKELLRQSDKSNEVEIGALKSDGDEFDVTMKFSNTTFQGEPCTQVVIRDQSASKELEEKLDSLSKQDLLTGLYNRRHFLNVLEQTVTAGTDQGALFYLEPDRFSEVRENVGIAAGDMVLADLATVLKKELEATQVLPARFDGPVFTLLATGPDADNAEQLGNRMLKQVADHVFDAAGRTLKLTCSVGVVLFDESLTDAQEVLNRGDRARRQSIEAGGNNIRIYNPAAEEMAEKERAAVWMRKLKLALRDNAFHLFYQPVVSLQGDPNENYEVYLRMTDEGQEVNPTEFIPAAQQTGLMIAVDRWVLHNSVRALIERRRTGKNTNFFVNLSEPSVNDPNLLPWLRELLKAARLDGACLVIEIPEAVAHANLHNVKTLFDGLAQLHVRTAIDHFGAAANSMHLLRHIQPVYLKLDGSLMEDFARNPELQQQVKELASQGKAANCLTVAEFVEDANTLAALWSCGIDYIQGYFLQRPSPKLNYDFSSGAAF